MLLTILNRFNRHRMECFLNELVVTWKPQYSLPRESVKGDARLGLLFIK